MLHRIFLATALATLPGFALADSVTQLKNQPPDGAEETWQLTDGTVLVTGGGAHSANPNTQAYAKAELFDPNGGMFTLTKVDMTTPRSSHTATLLSDGTVLVTGGANGTGTTLASAELYH